MYFSFSLSLSPDSVMESSEDDRLEIDSDEYFTSVSAIIDSDCMEKLSKRNKPNDANHVKGQQRNHALSNYTTHVAIDTAKHFIDENKQSASIYQPVQSSNVLDTENRCNTHPIQTNNNIVASIQRNVGVNGDRNQKAHRRNHTKNSLESVTVLNSNNGGSVVGGVEKIYKNHFNKHGHNEQSDSSDLNSEKNLVIENMRNRESEMYQKISFNNGYFSTTGSSSGTDYMYSDTNSIESAIVSNGMKKSCYRDKCDFDVRTTAKKSPKFVTKRKCRSFPLTENRQTEKVLKSKFDTTKTKATANEFESNTYQNSRKITITIKTTKTNPEPAPKQTIENYLSNACEISDESDTTVSDYATIRNENDAICAKSAIFHEDDRSDNESTLSNENSFFSVKSDNECQSEISQYFNCISSNDLNVENDLGKMEEVAAPKSDENNCEKRKKKLHLKKEVRIANDDKRLKRKSPMICIEQELSENRIVTSRIEVDKAQLKEFKRRQKQHRKIIDSSFSEEIFKETLNLKKSPNADISQDPRIINDIVASIKAEERERKITSRPKNDMRKYFDDGYMFDRAKDNQKCAGIVQRIEQHTLTNVRRSLLRNVAYAITESERLEKIEKKNSINDLPPIKPPRSFIASASSSPLSKQSFESSATVPIADLNRQHPMGFVVPPNNLVGEEHSVQFGWVRPSSNLDIDDSPAFLTANSEQTKVSRSSQVNDMEFHTPIKEDIDTVDGPNATNKDFEQFSAKLSENRCRNLSTPIKQFADSANNTQYASIVEGPDEKVANVCKNCMCHMKKESPQQLRFGKTGKRIGKAALKRTKTLIGTSKKLLKSSKKDKKDNPIEETFHTPQKDDDNTVYNNRDTINVNDVKKRVNKSLNLTPKNPQLAVQLIPSPNRLTEISNVRLLKDAKSPNKESETERNNDSEDVYVTPDEAFDFNRVIDCPHVVDKPKSVKRSPSKMISKLAKSSKKLFGLKSRETSSRGDSSQTESTHYYKANDYDEVDNKVLLMGEMLSEMRKQIENGQGSSQTIDVVDERPPSSAKKCLFRERTCSTSSGDLLEQESLVEQIARIDLHDEPEPLYAEIEQKQDKTMYRSCIDGDEVDSTKSIELQEVFIGDKNKYIMVNNNPKILYATVNRQTQRTKSLETIESKPSEQEEKSLQLNSSYESLDMSLINDFATAMQTQLDECQFKMNEIFSQPNSEAKSNELATSDHQSHSGTSLAISDMNSGCSSFYRRNKEIVSKRNVCDFVDALSFDTVGTGSYCESLSRGNDLNNEIKNTITSLEYMPSEMDDSTDDFTSNNAAFRSCRVNDSSRVS